MSPEACALLADAVLEAEAERLDDDVVLAQREADWLAFMAAVEADWRL